MPRVLIADDEESMRTLVARAIAMDGHATVTAEDGAEALEILSRENGAFDLLLTDIQMPVMDGIALALAAARDFPDLTILLMTGFADQRERAPASTPSCMTWSPNHFRWRISARRSPMRWRRRRGSRARTLLPLSATHSTRHAPRKRRVSSTPRLIDSIADVSGILGRPVKTDDDSLANRSAQ